ncbi:DUF2515 family protein [Priestia flexa]|uniref:DUF2515 family protein n=1 Tax=Priestia flexa TaxID=86664 RepID=UPI00240E01C2|nr:DUF2515 family protein [Priestia flexa]WEZ10085.1 DUF2515 family protein [Priestia flexa]
MIYSLPFKVNKTMTIETTNNLAHLNTQSLAILSSFSNTFELNEKESKLVQRIKKNVRLHNKNNITRTHAYLEFYKRYPEIKWAFLAHLVSRNGGYYMTDLQTTFAKKLLSPVQQHAFFLFLERANAAIFQDAFSQLLLYEESQKNGQNLSHLLTALGVSAFMHPIWTEFINEPMKKEHLLSLALIVNEQHYIENKLIQDGKTKEDVLDTWQFYAQSFLGMTQVLIPYESNNQLALVGVNISQFSSLKNRIIAGKLLYALLFLHSHLYSGTYSFADSVKHTGARQDYSSSLHSKFNHFKSPSSTLPLDMCWGNRVHTFFNQSDWFVGTSPYSYLAKLDMPTLI